MNIFKNKWSKFFIFPQVYWHLGVALLCLLLSACLGFWIPRLLQGPYQFYHLQEKFFQQLWLLFFVFLAEYFNRLLYQTAINKYVQQVVQDVRMRCYRQWLLCSEVQISGKVVENSFPLGEVLARIMNDTEAMRELVTSGSLSLFIDVFFILSCLLSFFSIHPIAGPYLIVLEILACVGLIWGGKSMMYLFMDVRKVNGEMARTVTDLTQGMGQLYYTQHYGHAHKKALGVFERFLHVQLKANNWDATYYSLAESLLPIFLFLVVLAFPMLHIQELAVMAVLIELIQRSISPIKDLTGKVASLQRAATGAIRLQEFLDHVESFPQTILQNANSLEDLERPLLDKIQVQIQSFSFVRKEQEDAQNFSLQNICFDAQAGQLVGIVGPSGHGKSTLLNILAGNLIPEQGQVTISFKNAQGEILPTQTQVDFHHHLYRQQVSIISQDSHIFSESLAFNITLDRSVEAPDSLMLQKFTKFWQKISQDIPYLQVWRGGKSVLDKVVVSELSAGQRQLLSALRAAFLKKPIVLFDEISSALDSDLEESLREAIEVVQKFSLTFFVSHRLETILKADKIIVLFNGKIEGMGTHIDLLQRSSTYQQFLLELRSEV